MKFSAGGCRRWLWAGALALAPLALSAPLRACAPLDFCVDPYTEVGSNVTVSETAPYTYQLTSGGNWQSGAIWNPDTVDLTQSFNLWFEMNFGSNGACGADGMTFTLQAQGLGALGETGGELGIGTGSAGSGAVLPAVSPAVSVEFDTFQNWAGDAPPNNNDPNYDHIMIDENGNVVHTDACGATAGGGTVTAGPGPAFCPVPALASEASIKDGAWHSVNIAWNAATKQMTVTFDGALRLTYANDMVANIFSGNSCVYLGFTAASGGCNNVQQVRLQQCLPSPTPSPTFSASPTPYPVGCGTPVALGASIVESGCIAASGAAVNGYTFPGGANSLLVLRVEGGAGTSAPSAATWDGIPMTAVGSVPGYTGNLAAFTLAGAPAGAHAFTLTYAGGTCSFNVAAEAYTGVDQASPIGATSTVNGTAPAGSPSGFTTTLTTTGPASLLSDYLAIAQVNGGGVVTGLGAGQVDENLVSGCCEGTYGDTKDVNGPAAYTLTYTLAQSKQYASQLLEIKGAAACGGSPSPSASPSASPSVTSTGTPSRSPSPSATATGTASPSATPSASPSATLTASASPSQTPSFSPSVTPSLTLTPSPTRTASPTPSDTFSPGPSPTSSPSSSSTPTLTRTATSTDSPSATPSATSTLSLTDTPSLTPSPSSSATASQTASASQTPSCTATPSATATLTATPTGTQTQTFSATATFSDSPSATPSPTQTLSSSDTATGTPTLTLTASPTRTCTFSVTQTFTVSPTATPSPQPEPIRLTVDVYNAAGERVAVLYQGSAASVPGSVTLANGLLIEGAGAAVLGLGTALANGSDSVGWSGTNGAGQPVAGGVYYLRVEFADNFGQATTYVKQVQVLASPASVPALGVYNSAGELVWQGSLPAGTAPGAALSLPDPVLVQDQGPSGAGALAIVVGAVTVHWNGKNLAGLAVGPGTYTVELSEQLPGAGTSVQTKQCTVLASPLGLPSADARVAPNPWRGGAALVAIYTPSPGFQGAGTLYTLSGERVEAAQDEAASGRLQFPGKNLSSGVYLLDFRQMQGSTVVVRKVLKVAVVP